MASWIEKLKTGLAKTRENTVGRIAAVLRGKGSLDEETLSGIEEALLLSDMGMDLCTELIDGLRQKAREEKRNDLPFVTEYLQNEIALRTQEKSGANPRMDETPWVILIVGVNGVGKTTTIGKMAHLYTQQGKKVLIAAGDTFRAAAGEQLTLWAQKAGADIVRHQDGADPAAVVFDAAEAARARGMDVVLVDTAGRLHTKSPLMEELKKIRRVLGKQNPRAPHETLLILDATTGQNALSQARAFTATVECTGLVVTKLDGTAKGGMILSVQKELGLPVRWIGVGEGVDDLKPFSAKEYAQALFTNDRAVENTGTIGSNK